MDIYESLDAVILEKLTSLIPFTKDNFPSIDYLGAVPQKEPHN